MNGNFPACLATTLVYEGGYVNDPHDPGGKTYKGVTQKTYDNYRMRRGQPKQDVRSISQIELQALYKAGYWDKVNGDGLASGVDMVMFDYAVNSGPMRAASAYRMASAKSQNAVILINSICDQRLKFLKGLKTFGRFGTGWTKRVSSVRAKGLAMNASAPHLAVGLLSKEADEATGKAKASTNTAGGVVGTVVSAAAAAPSVMPSGIDLTYVWIGLGVIGVLVAGFFIWKAMHHKAAAKEITEVANGL